MLTRLTRAVASPWARAFLAVAVVACCAFGVAHDWADVQAGLRRLHWYTVGGSLAAAMAGSACMAMAWRAVLGDLGSELPRPAALRVCMISLLAKYVPGGVWAVAAQVELGHKLGVPRPRSLAAVATTNFVMVGSGLGVAAATLPLTRPALAARYWWVLIVVPVVAVVLCPPVLDRVLGRLLALTRRPPEHDRPTWGGIGRSVGWSLAGWLAMGVQVWLLASAAGGLPPSMVALAVGGYALAFCAGTILVFVPSGLGAREVILIAVLSQVLPSGLAVAITLVTRLVTTACDVTWAAVGLRLARPARERASADLVQTTPARPSAVAVFGTRSP